MVRGFDTECKVKGWLHLRNICSQFNNSQNLWHIILNFPRPSNFQAIFTAFLKKKIFIWQPQAQYRQQWHSFPQVCSSDCWLWLNDRKLDWIWIHSLVYRHESSKHPMLQNAAFFSLHYILCICNSQYVSNFNLASSYNLKLVVSQMFLTP